MLDSFFKFDMLTDEDRTDIPSDDDREGSYDVDLTCFDYVSLEEINVIDYLKESCDNIIVISGENRYAVKRTNLSEFSNRPSNQFNGVTGSLFVQLPTRELIHMLNFCNMLIHKFSVFVIEPSDKMVRVVDCTGEIALRKISLVNVYRMEDYFRDLNIKTSIVKCGDS